MTMQQPNLFDKTAEPLVPAPPNLDRIRKYLSSTLGMLRRADIMPWHKADADHWERYFPELARQLPTVEAESLISAFEGEIMRLKQSMR